MVVEPMCDEISLTPEAENLLKKLQPRIEERLAEANRTPVSILIWGPGIDASSPLAKCRQVLRKNLRKIGHAACFSEELCDPKKKDSIRLQQLAQAQEFDLIVSIPGTPGSIGEIHDFTSDRRVHAKTIVFLNEEYLGGYSAQSIQAISTVISCKIEYYPNSTDYGIIEKLTYEEVQKIREMKYILSGRY